MPLSKTDTYTTDYIYNLPEGQRAELIDGQVYNMAPTNRIHQELVMQLSTTINNHVKKTMAHVMSFRHPLQFS